MSSTCLIQFERPPFLVFLRLSMAQQFLVAAAFGWWEGFTSVLSATETAHGCLGVSCRGCSPGVMPGQFYRFYFCGCRSTVRNRTHTAGRPTLFLATLFFVRLTFSGPPLDSKLRSLVLGPCLGVVEVRALVCSRARP